MVLLLPNPGSAVDVVGTVEAFALDPSPGFVFPYTGPGDVVGPLPVRAAKVIVNDDETLVAHTDADGDFVIATTIEGTVEVTVKVLLSHEGSPGFFVVNQSGPTLQLTLAQAAGDPFEFTAALGRAFNMNATEHDTAQVSAFLYVERISAFLQTGTADWIPPYSPPTARIEPNIDESLQPCNQATAAWTTGRILTSEARSCPGGDPALLRNVAYAVPLYHEYTHHFFEFLNSFGHVYTSEAFADLIPAFYTGDPVLGRDLWGAGTFVRDLREDWIHPIAWDGNNHRPGRPFTSSMWDLREAMIAADPVQGASDALDLVFETMRLQRGPGAVPPPYEDLLADVLQADANLFNSANAALITEVFARHNLPPVSFLRGDANDDGRLNISDYMRIRDWLFFNTGEIVCMDAADVNDDGAVSVSDMAYVLNWLFFAGPSPRAPYPDCGIDETSWDTLLCEQGCG